jgi:hypothetical protein
VTITSLPSSVPATVPAPITGRATAMPARSSTGVPPDGRLSTDVAGMGLERGTRGAAAPPQSISSRNAGM